MTVRVTDRGGLFATQTFTATVAPVAVPNVVGLAPEWAESFITAADLTVGHQDQPGRGGHAQLRQPAEQAGVDLLRRCAGSSRVETHFSVAAGVCSTRTRAGFAAGCRLQCSTMVDSVWTAPAIRGSARARVLEEEGRAATRIGFDLRSRTGADRVRLGLGTKRFGLTKARLA